MANIKLIHQDTDISKLSLHPVNWDLEVNGRPYQVYDVYGKDYCKETAYIHTIGGRWGNNSYWACPLGQEPTVRNLIEFSGHPVQWGIECTEHNNISSKWDETEIRDGLRCNITRNGKLFYSVAAGRMDYGIAQAYALLLSEIHEGPINFNMRGYVENEILGRHVWYKQQPYTITHYCEGQCCAIAYPGHFDPTKIDVYKEFKDTHMVKIDLLMDKHLNWFSGEY